jgi:O-antigen ligase
MTDRSRVAAFMLDRSRWVLAADLLAVAVVISLPWSTSATSILIAAWLIALLPTVRPRDLWEVVAEPAGGLPVAIWLLAIIGMLWASGVSLGEQVSAIRGFHKLLVIPLLMVQFRRSDKAHWVLTGYLASCTALLVASWLMVVFPSLWVGRWPGVPVKDYLVQSIEFLLACFVAAHLAVTAGQQQRRGICLLLGAVAILFLLNVAFVAAGRTVLTAFPLLLLLLGAQRFGPKGIVTVVIGGAVLMGVLWSTSPYLRARAYSVVQEVQDYRSHDARTSAGMRLVFWQKSIPLVAEAPILGHGTGTIAHLFEQGAVGRHGMAAVVTGNPHNQMLEIAVQFGLLGVGLLFALWLAQLLLFRGGGLAAWLGAGLVVQGVVGSLFLSYMFDFTTGWTYAFGVGVLGGIMLRTRARGCASRQAGATPAG